MRQVLTVSNLCMQISKMQKVDEIKLDTSNVIVNHM